MQFRVLVVTDPHTHKQTHPATHRQTGPITIHCATASTQCNETVVILLTQVVADETIRQSVLSF